VLDPEEFASQGLPDAADEPKGLAWDQLARMLTAAAACGGCLGWSLAIYDPDQDPERSDAHRILRLITDVMTALPHHSAWTTPAMTRYFGAGDSEHRKA
jgi:arginase